MLNQYFSSAKFFNPHHFTPSVANVLSCSRQGYRDGCMICCFTTHSRQTIDNLCSLTLIRVPTLYICLVHTLKTLDDMSSLLFISRLFKHTKDDFYKRTICKALVHWSKYTIFLVISYNYLNHAQKVKIISC